MKKLLLTALTFTMGLAAVAQAPKADVLDIIFNDDGTVVDASAMANPVRVLGNPDIKKSPMYGMNVLCNEETQWGKESFHTVRIPYNDQLIGAIENGMTMEVMARPCFEDGKFNQTWCNVFGCYQGGGFGIIINGGKWDFECVIGGGYKDATFGPVVDGEWIHLVGVWDKETGEYKLYANGELASTVDGVSGDLSLPDAKGKERFVGVGVDFEPNPVSTCGYSFQGDIAIARIYDNPLTAEQVKALYQEVDVKKTGEVEHVDRVFPTLRTDEDGTVLIANYEEMDNFAHSVRMGKIDLNAKLEADIDFTASKRNICYERGYTGTFDGQGHTLKVDIKSDQRTAAPFMALRGATIRNLNVTGTVTASAQYASSVAVTTENNTVIDRVSSDVNIISTTVGDGTHGGFVGVSSDGTVISNSVFKGSITSEVTNSCAGFVGWTDGNTTIKNCLQLADIGNVAEKGAVFARNPSKAKVTNCYYSTLVGDSDNGATLVADDELGSGEICWKLNGETATRAIWRQTLEQDETPVLDQTHGMVLVLDGSTYCITNEETLKEAARLYADQIEVMADEFEAYQPLKDALRQHAQEAAACTTVDDFVAKCAQIEADIALINENKKAYDNLILVAEATLEKIEGMVNEPANVLRTYLEDTIEPNEVYVNGSLNYILNNYSLSTEGIAKEIAYIDDMVLKALSSGTPAGTDVTMLVQNADFRQKAEGWEWIKKADKYEQDASWGFSGIHYYGSLEGGFSQTITGLTNGVYELDMNGCQLVGDEASCNYYTSVLFAGDIEMPLMSTVDDVILDDDPLVPGIKKLGGVRTRDNQIIPYSLRGAAYAMCQGGYYLNRVFAHVTDGTLTIGGKLYGSGRSDDWPIFANVKLIYQGSFDEASEALDKGLQFAVARADSTINFKADAWSTNYIIYPNYSEELRNGLRQAVADVETATTGEQKYNILKRMSDLFKQIYVCRRAYTKSAGELIALEARAQDYPEFADELMIMIDKAWAGWNSGAYSAEEVVNISAEILEKMDNLNVELPDADLLDLVFNEDGTAKDNSEAANQVEMYGKPSVVASPTLGMNVYCGGNETWGTYPQNNFLVNVSDAMKQSVENGVTMELLVRPYWKEGGVPGKWCTVFGSENSGGMGMLVYNSQWCFEAHTGGSYHDAYATVKPVNGEWTHLIGTWDGGELKIYVNGELSGSVLATGGYDWPVNVDRQWFGVGCDMALNDKPEAAFTGDIAIVRMYKTPLNGSQVNRLYKRVKGIISDTPEHNEGETAVTGVTAVKPANGIIYDITGRRLSRMDTKGLYIVNGKKIAVK